MAHSSFAFLTASQASFVDRVCAHLHANRDEAQIAVYGDGSASPNGEKFAAERLSCSWKVVFDFGTGRCFETHVQLPDDWRTAKVAA
jgi:hypothetical protein